MAAAEPLLPSAEADGSSSAPTHQPGTGEAWRPSMQELLTHHSDQLVRAVQDVGVTKLGRLSCQDLPATLRLSPGSILTAGAALPDCPWPQLWSAQLKVPLNLLGVQVEGGDQATGTPASASLKRRMHRPDKRWSFIRLLVTNKMLRSSVAADSWAAETRFDCFLVNIKDAAAPGSAGLLHALLRRYREGAASLSVFGLPAVQAVVQHKWTTFAQRLLLVDLAFFVLWLAAFTTFMILYNDEDATLPLRELAQSWRGRASLTCDILVLLGMFPFVLLDVTSLLTRCDYWWLWSFWKALDFVIYAAQILISSLHFGPWDAAVQVLPVLIGVQYVFMWLRLQYFSRAFRSTRFDFMDSLHVVLADVWWYLLVMLLLMWGFAGAFFMLFKGAAAGGTSNEQFASLPLSMLTMFNYAVGGTSYYIGGMLHGQHPMPALVLCIVYQFVVSMVLMALLTGVMANALTKVTASEGLRLTVSRAEIIDELEALRPLAGLLSPSSTVRAWHPAYIYVLRLDPSSRETVDESDLWVSPTGMPTAAAQTSAIAPQLGPAMAPSAATLDALKSQVQTLESKLDTLSNQVDTLQQLLRQVLQPTPGLLHRPSTGGSSQGGDGPSNTVVRAWWQRAPSLHSVQHRNSISGEQD